MGQTQSDAIVNTILTNAVDGHYKDYPLENRHWNCFQRECVSKLLEKNTLWYQFPYDDGKFDLCIDLAAACMLELSHQRCYSIWPFQIVVLCLTQRDIMNLGNRLVRALPGTFFEGSYEEPFQFQYEGTRVLFAPFWNQEILRGIKVDLLLVPQADHLTLEMQQECIQPMMISLSTTRSIFMYSLALPKHVCDSLAEPFNRPDLGIYPFDFLTETKEAAFVWHMCARRMFIPRGVRWIVARFLINTRHEECWAAICLQQENLPIPMEIEICL